MRGESERKGGRGEELGRRRKGKRQMSGEVEEEERERDRERDMKRKTDEAKGGGS